MGLACVLGGAVFVLEQRRTATPQPDTPSCTPSSPCLAVVIDDLGRRLSDLRALLEIPLDLTFSLLPHARQSVATVMVLRAANREYWLHLPLEPLDPRTITDEPMVLRRRAPVEAGLASALVFVPGISGASSHMGSAFTADPSASRQLMSVFRAASLPFLDSKTIHGSFACKAAEAYGVPCLERDVFLDDSEDPATVGHRLEAALRVARRRGWAVAIGHPKQRTLRALRRLAGTAAAVTIVRLSKIFARVDGRSSETVRRKTLDARKTWVLD